HWGYETGYSFPSGHSFSAMFFAIFLFLICSTLIKDRNVRWIYVLLPWGVAVCFSRPM
ncbi:phosphatase PAP2 family protein, partial [Neptuniibacter sp. UBA847]